VQVALVLVRFERARFALAAIVLDAAEALLEGRSTHGGGKPAEVHFEGDFPPLLSARGCLGI
jgi:hypothetical protein